jgi:hypothetical protein
VPLHRIRGTATIELNEALDTNYPTRAEGGTMAKQWETRDHLLSQNIYDAIKV